MLDDNEKIISETEAVDILRSFIKEDSDLPDTYMYVAENTWSQSEKFKDYYSL